MDPKRVKKNYNSLTKIFQKTSEMSYGQELVTGSNSKLTKWCELNNFKIQRCESKVDCAFESFSYLIYSNIAKVPQCKTKLVNYLINHSAKFDLFLKQNTEFDGIDAYLTQIKTKSIDTALEFVCLLAAYHHNIKILYYNGESLKEKSLCHGSKNASDDASSMLPSDQNEDSLTLFVTGQELVPLLHIDEDDSDTDSEKSAELLSAPILLDRPEVRVSGGLSQNGEETENSKPNDKINKLIADEPEAKYANDTPTKQELLLKNEEDDDSYILNDIWNRPQDDSDKRSNDSNTPKFQPNLFSPPKPAPTKKEESSNSKMSRENKKKRNMAMRLAYQKGSGARSDEQAFNVQKRHPILMQNDKRSLIEEEVKSSSNLNLSTSSRSYKPGGPKSQHSFYSNPSGPMSVSSSSNYQAQKYPNGIPPQSNSHYFYQNPTANALQIPPPGLTQKFPPKPIPDPSSRHFGPQYNYSMGMIQSQPMYPTTAQTSGTSSFAPTQPKPLTTTPMYTKPSTLTNDRPLEASKEQNEIGSAVKVANTSASSSNMTSDTTSPPAGDLMVGTGMLKFFNQQHQYGFIVYDKDGSDIFFHYDDVKHTQLSKEFLRHATENYDVRFSFQILDYIGKYESSKKAVNINLLSIIAK
uniref:CSD domain-containing protein n=1 Tax=Euplotes crassus TaxID=5936 RepID=A0A7S3NTR8_EUPCR|mmetsp:Transcript_20597/g.20325  ORF Transcript_20597/g.20325 Transcript_20597/m.20325 type:complete len:638 (+) Transcript_20597:6-1919(+)